MKTACFSLEIIYWNHTCQYSDEFHFPPKIHLIPLFIKFLLSLHYIYSNTQSHMRADVDVNCNLVEAYSHEAVDLVCLLQDNLYFELAWLMLYIFFSFFHHPRKYKLNIKKKSPEWCTTCDKTSHRSCDLTAFKLHYLGIYMIRVRANANGSHSAWVQKEFCPDKDGEREERSRGKAGGWG